MYPYTGAIIIQLAPLQAIETAKTKERIDRQLVGQSSSMPFMNIKDGYISKKVTFHTQDGLEEKIDSITLMMSKLTAQDDSQNKQFKPNIYQSKRKGQIRNFYNRCNYDQRIYQNRYRSNSGDRRIYSVAEYNMDRIIEIVLGIIRTIEIISGQEILEVI